MKKILFITYNFAPRQSIGSIRPTRMIMYLAKMGYEVDVVCSENYGMMDHSMDEVFNYIHRVDRITHLINNEKNIPIIENVSAKSSANPPKKTNALVLRYHELKRIHYSKKFANDFEEMIKNDMTRFSSYDVMISTYGPLESHLCALKVKKYFPNLRWIADFRDSMILSNLGFFVNSKRKRIQKTVCGKAQRLVSISRGTFDEIFTEKEFKDKACVIYNGYDKSDFPESKNNYDGAFSFLCIGNMYAGKRDISVLCRALSELCSEKEIDKNDIKINYVGNNFYFLKAQAAEYSLEDCLIDLGFVPRDKCMEYQTMSRYLLLPNWNFNNSKGVITGKFFEYIVTGRPILSIVRGDAPNSEISELIAKYRLGFCYEQANDEADYPKLKRFLKEEYLRYKNGLDSEILPDTKSISEFDYETITKQFAELI